MQLLKGEERRGENRLRNLNLLTAETEKKEKKERKKEGERSKKKESPLQQICSPCCQNTVSVLKRILSKNTEVGCKLQIANKTKFTLTSTIDISEKLLSFYHDFKLRQLTVFIEGKFFSF